MDDYNIKLEENIFPIIKNIKNPNILELGVQNGTSTNTVSISITGTST